MTQTIANFIASIEMMAPGNRAVPTGATVTQRDGKLQLIVDFHMEPLDADP